MKMKLIACIYIFLILSSFTMERRKFKSRLQKRKGNGATKAGYSALAVGGIGSCIKAFMAAVPPSFCWRKSVIPNKCPEAYPFKSMALCYHNCRTGYNFVGGVCWQACPLETYDTGAFCHIDSTNILRKHSYIPSSLTNFDDQVPCPDGFVKTLAHCSIDCKTLGLTSCGPGACAGSDDICKEEIRNMILDTIIGVASFIAFALTVGTSSGAITGIKSALKNISTTVFKKGIGLSKLTFKGFKDKIINNAKLIWKNYAKGQIMTIAANKIPEGICDVYFQQQADKMNNLNENETKENIMKSAEDYFKKSSVNGIINDCKLNKTTTDNEKVGCAKTILSTLSNFDPTGLIGIATTFMHPVCGLPLPPPPTEIENPAELPKDDYMFFYSECFFKGELTKIKLESTNYNPNWRDYKFGLRNNSTSWRVAKNIYGFMSNLSSGMAKMDDINVFGPGEDELCAEREIRVTDTIYMFKTTEPCILVNSRVVCNGLHTDIVFYLEKEKQMLNLMLLYANTIVEIDIIKDFRDIIKNIEIKNNLIISLEEFIKEYDIPSSKLYSFVVKNISFSQDIRPIKLLDPAELSDNSIIFYPECFFKGEPEKIFMKKELYEQAWRNYRFSLSANSKSWKVAKNLYGFTSDTADGFANLEGFNVFLPGEYENCADKEITRKERIYIFETTVPCILIDRNSICYGNSNVIKIPSEVGNPLRINLLNRNTKVGMIVKNKEDGNPIKNIEITNSEKFYKKYFINKYRFSPDSDYWIQVKNITMT